MRPKFNPFNLLLTLPMFFPPDDGGGNIGGARATTPPHTGTGASPGKNTGEAGGGAETPPAPSGNSGAQGQGNSQNGKGNPPDATGDTKDGKDGQDNKDGQNKDGQSKDGKTGDKTTGKPLAKPITTQEEFDAALKDRLQREQANAQREADRKAAEAKGEWEKVLKLERDSFEQEKKDLAQQVKDLETENTRLQETIAKDKRANLVAKVAGEFRLPQELAERLQGNTEAELKKDAEKIAKVAGLRVAPHTEGGHSPQLPNGTPPAPAPQENYSFNTPGGVKW